MDSGRPNLLVLYEDEPPETLLLTCLSAYAVELLAAEKLGRGVLSAADWRRHPAILIFAPTSLPQGRALCRTTRRLTNAPILLIAPSSAPDETLLMLQEGADLLLPPDADPTIVAGYVGAFLRRWQDCAAELAPMPTSLVGYHDAILDFDLVRRSVRVDGRVVRLTPTEYRFLAALVRHMGELLTYAQIASIVWDSQSFEPRVIHTFAAQVRAKLGERVAHYIVNEYGNGYRFSPPKR